MLGDTELALMPPKLEISTEELWAEPERNILLDDDWAREVAAGRRLPTVRVWRHAPVQGLVVSKRDVAGERGIAAMTEMAHRGWTIFQRPTGGTAVPHESGVLNLSLLLPRTSQKVSTDGYYRLLCQPIIDWLADMGLAAATGDLPGSYCDGNYNVLVDGQKLVGTAQAWRGGLAGAASRHPGYVLAHACIVINVPLAAATEAINQLYAAVDNPYRVDAATSTSLAQCLMRHGLPTLDSAAAQTAFSRFLQTYYEAQGLHVQMAESSPQS